MNLPKLILTERDRQLIKRALQWPLVWRSAVRWAAAQSHSEYTKVCFPCAARDRLLKDKHAPTTGMDREVYCAKCGLHHTYWKVLASLRRAAPASAQGLDAGGSLLHGGVVG